jgi:hypothetical protein
MFVLIMHKKNHLTDDVLRHCEGHLVIQYQVSSIAQPLRFEAKLR